MELLVVIAIIGVLAALLLPAYDLAKVKAQRGVCGARIQSLLSAWSLFSEDNGDQLVENQPLLAPGVPNDDSWFPGSARLDHDAMYGPAPYYTATNQALARNSRLYSYVNATEFFRCPSDQRAVDGQRAVRSYSLNCWMNGQSMADPSGLVSMALDEHQNDDLLQFRFYRKQNQFSKPTELLVFIEESEKTLTDSMFAAVKNLANARDVADHPSTRHRNSCPVGFADGHQGFLRLSLSGKLRSLKNSQDEESLQAQDLERISTLSTEKR